MKVAISVSIDDKHIKYMKDRGINPSKWVNEKMNENFKDRKEMIKELKEEIKIKQKNVNKIEKEISEEENKATEITKNLSKEAINEIKESKRILEKDNHYFEGRFGRFKNLFKSDIDKETFRKLIVSIKL